MGSVLLQADKLVESINSWSQGKDSVNFEFEKSPEVMRLEKISFVSRSTVSPLENSRHIFVGEAAAVR